MTFACNKCGAIFKSENSEKNHKKTCEGDRNNEDGTKTCGRCDRTLQARNMARHKRQNCKGNRVPEQEANEQHHQPRVYKQKWTICPRCNERKSASNLARHLRICTTSGQRTYPLNQEGESLHRPSVHSGLYFFVSEKTLTLFYFSFTIFFFTICFVIKPNSKDIPFEPGG